MAGNEVFVRVDHGIHAGHRKDGHGRHGVRQHVQGRVCQHEDTQPLEAIFDAIPRPTYLLISSKEGHEKQQDQHAAQHCQTMER